MSEDRPAPIDFGRNPFGFSVGEAFATLKLIGDLAPDLVKEFERRIRPDLEKFDGDLVLDLTECGEISPAWTRALMAIAAHAKKNQKRMRAVTGNPAHKAFFSGQGVAANFPIVPDLATAARELAAKKSAKLDVAFVNPFLVGTVEVLKIQAKTAAKPGNLAPRDAQAPLEGDLSGVIALESAAFVGTIVLSFPEATYLKIVSRMLGEEQASITAGNRDGASELTNMIFGYAKRVLSGQGHSVKMAIPRVAAGRTPADLPAVIGTRIAVPFESDAGPFTVEIRARAL